MYDNVYTKRGGLEQGKKSFPEASANFAQPKMITCLFLNQSLARGNGTTIITFDYPGPPLIATQQGRRGHDWERTTRHKDRQ